MENDAYQEYFKSKSNKLSLAMWVLINNNVVSRNLYILMLCIEFIINILLILCLYNEVHSIPTISKQVINILDYNDARYLSIVAIVHSGIHVVTLAFICLMIFKDYSWQTYSEKKIVFQVQSFIIVLFRSPLYSVSILLILDNLFSFSSLDSVYLKSISAICSILCSIILVVYSYAGSYLFNLSIPNEHLPWSDTSH
jgi:hypothetical protein